MASRHEVGSARTDSGHPIRGGDKPPEEQASEGYHRISLWRGNQRNQEERKFQTCRYVEVASPAKKGISPFTKEPCVFKSNPASNTLRALAMKKLKEALN